MTLKINSVFVPTGQPTHTYVRRDDARLEQELIDAIETPNMVTSISGPSKSGKTVLFRRVVKTEDSVDLSGSQIRGVDDFFRTLVAKLGGPLDTSRSVTRTTSGEVSGSGSASINGLLAKGNLTGGGKYGVTDGEVVSERHQPDPFDFIALRCSKGPIIFIDDFHYIPKPIQIEIARIVKSLAEKGVKFCIASVPHKSDDAVRANPELRGRLAAVQVGPWSPAELVEIGQKGFDALNIGIEKSTIEALAVDALGSPQLMQALCLNICRELKIIEKQQNRVLTRIAPHQLAAATKRTAALAEFSTLVQILHQGPKAHGNDRKEYDFYDGTRGDSYRALFLAIAFGEARMQFDYDELINRVKTVCKHDYPRGSNFIRILPLVAELANKQAVDDEPVLDWSDDLLTITDPYFLFYIRSSDTLKNLAN